MCAVAQNKWADRSRPLVVHACSSTTYPYSHYKIYRENVYPFYQQNPCKLRFTLGSYVRCLPASSSSIAPVQTADVSLGPAYLLAPSHQKSAAHCSGLRCDLFHEDVSSVLCNLGYMKGCNDLASLQWRVSGKQMQ